MRNGWEIKKLGEICTVIAGQSPEGKYYNDEGNGLPFYQGKKEFTEKLIGKPTTWTSVITKEAIKDDILMSVRAPVGPVNFSTQRICIGRGLAAIRAGKSIDKDFLFNFLVKHENEIEGNEGAVFNSINKTQIENIEVPLPPLYEQKRILSILEVAFVAIDKAKSNSEKNLQNAKNLLSSVTNSYFNSVNKSNHSTIDELTDFITDFVANGSFASLRENVEYKREKDYAVLIRLLDHSNDFEGDFVYINKKAYEFLSKSKVYPNDIIVSNVGARLGTVFRAPNVGMPMSLGPNSILLKANEFGDYLFCWLTSSEGQNAIKEIVSGAGQPKFNKTEFKKIKIPIPKDKVQREKIILKINETTKQSKDLERVYSKKISALEELKKSVLQKAFAGELSCSTEKITA